MSKMLLKVGKKGTIYLPKKILAEMNIKEGDSVIVKIENNKLVLEIIPDPLALALKVKKWAETTVEEFEKESEAIQEDLYGS